MAIADLTGQKFGDWTVLRLSHRTPRRPRGYRDFWVCRCVCSAEQAVEHYNLTRGHSTGCGACAGAKIAQAKLIHGNARKRAGHRPTPEYRAWQKAKARCYDVNDPGFPRYGGRGITMCDVWRTSFDAFLADVGPRPSASHSLDRINNDGHYEPGNCRWATKAEQRRNQTRVKLAPADVHAIRAARERGESERSLARRYGVVRHTIHSIVDREIYADV